MPKAPVKCTCLLLGSCHHVCTHDPRPFSPNSERLWSWYRLTYPNRLAPTLKRSRNGPRRQFQGQTLNPWRALLPPPPLQFNVILDLPVPIAADSIPLS